MSPARLVRRFPITAFAALACVFGALPYLLAALGLDSDPSNMPLGPVLAALVVVACQGRDGWRTWWSQLRCWRSAPSLYAVAVLAPLALTAVAVVVNGLLGSPLPTPTELSAWPEVPVTFVFMMVMVGIGEEAGWTAFAAPVLLRRHGLLGAWLVMSAIRIFWHLPLMISGELPWALGVMGMLGFQLFVLQLLRHGGSWVHAAVWHSLLNAVGGGFVFGMYVGADQLQLGVIMGVAYLMLGLATLLPRAGARPTATATATATATVRPAERAGAVLR